MTLRISVAAIDALVPFVLTLADPNWAQLRRFPGSLLRFRCCEELPPRRWSSRLVRGFADGE